VLVILPATDVWKPEWSLSARVIEPRPPAYMSEHVNAADTSTNWACQRTSGIAVELRQQRHDERMNGRLNPLLLTSQFISLQQAEMFFFSFKIKLYLQKHSYVSKAFEFISFNCCFQHKILRMRLTSMQEACQNSWKHGKEIIIIDFIIREIANCQTPKLKRELNTYIRALTQHINNSSILIVSWYKQ